MLNKRYKVKSEGGLYVNSFILDFFLKLKMKGWERGEEEG